MSLLMLGENILIKLTKNSIESQIPSMILESYENEEMVIFSFCFTTDGLNY